MKTMALVFGLVVSSVGLSLPQEDATYSGGGSWISDDGAKGTWKEERVVTKMGEEINCKASLKIYDDKNQLVKEETYSNTFKNKAHGFFDVYHETEKVGSGYCVTGKMKDEVCHFQMGTENVHEETVHFIMKEKVKAMHVVGSSKEAADKPTVAWRGGLKGKE